MAGDFATELRNVLSITNADRHFIKADSSLGLERRFLAA